MKVNKAMDFFALLALKARCSNLEKKADHANFDTELYRCPDTLPFIVVTVS